MSDVFLIIIFFGIPVASFIFFVVSLILFIDAVIGNKKGTEGYTKKRIRNNLIILIVSLVIAAVLAVYVVELIVFLNMPIVYM